jgi:hypothetical protein
MRCDTCGAPSDLSATGSHLQWLKVTEQVPSIAEGASRSTFPK